MDNEDLDRELAHKHMELNSYMMQFFKENFRGPFNFEHRNRGQAYVLAILKKHNSISQKDLVALLEIRAQSASEIIRKLERKEFITRTKSEEDKRIMLIELTEAGKVEANKTGEFKPIMLDVLTEKEKEQFNNILNKLLADIKGRVKKEPRHRMPPSHTWWYEN